MTDVSPLPPAPAPKLPFRALTIRPGLLVAMKTSVVGGVEYKKEGLETSPDGTVTKWETTRIIPDVATYEAAKQARNKAAAEIRRSCALSSFGLLCPTALESTLDIAIQRSQEIVEAFNQGSSLIKIKVYAVKGRIADNDEQAARAVADDVRTLIETMGQSVEALDPEKIREAAAQAKNLLSILSEEKQRIAGQAIDAARAAARAIVKRIEKGGEDAAKVLLELDTKAIGAARMAFLDLEPEAAPAGEAAPAIEVQRFADLEPDASADPAEHAEIAAEALGEIPEEAPALDGVDDLDSVEKEELDRNLRKFSPPVETGGA